MTKGTALSRGYLNHRYSDDIAWIRKPKWDDFKKDIEIISTDRLNGDENNPEILEFNSQ